MLTKQFISKIALSAPIDPGSYLSGIPAVRDFQNKGSLEFTAPVTFLVGENGTGKSTFLEAIAAAYGFNPEGGTRNFSFRTRDSHSDLCKHITLVRRGYASDGFFLRAESFYNMATYIDSVDAAESYGGTSLHCRSHGESFLTLVQNRFLGNGLYLLDEPESALSPNGLLVLMLEMQRLVHSGSQLIIATHSPMLMAFPGAEVLSFTENGIAHVDYRETEHYRITRSFLDDPQRMLHHLLADM